MSERIVLLAFLLGLTACDALHPPKPDDPAFAPVSPTAMMAPPNTSGGLYQEGHSLALYETLRAKRVGDMVLISLDERTDASKRATTITRKNYDANLQNPTVLGSVPQFNTALLPLASNKSNNLQFNMSAQRNFDGQGESNQNNSLNGTVTATVVGVLPNGNMMIRGEKWVSLNQGNEFIRIRGIVRAADISPDNVVSSQRIADARITYSGTGAVSDTNATGWWSKFFGSALWIF
jgi:flagellar L-ring protein precursor FlgH